MSFFTGFSDEVKFISGADIAEIVKQALMDISVDAPITPTAWRNAVEKIIRSGLSTQGSSYANLNSIAACYLRLIRGNFQPACSEAQVLIRKEDYHVEWDEMEEKIKAHYNGKEPDNDYDRALYRAIVSRINRLAGTLENNEQMNLVL